MSRGSSHNIHGLPFRSSYHTRPTDVHVGETGIPINVSQGVVRTEARGIFISNLPVVIYRRDIEDHFRRAGTIVHTEMVTDAKTGAFKGVAIVRYSSPSEAQLAIRMFNESQWLGRILHVRKDREESIVPSVRTWSPAGQVNHVRDSSSEQNAIPSRQVARLERPLIVDGSQRK